MMIDDDECGALRELIGGEIEVFRVIPPQCHFVHHKSHMT
jgi:hypothetical protein